MAILVRDLRQFIGIRTETRLGGTMAFDERCWDLAKLFLEDGPRCLPADINELAQAIQGVCEDHCRMIDDQERPPLPWPEMHPISTPKTRRIGRLW